MGLLESGKEQGIIIARRGKPVAKLVPYKPEAASRIGSATEALVCEDWDMNEGDAEVASLFGVE